MLPFLKPKNQSVAGLIIKTRASDSPEAPEQDENDKSGAIEACSQALITAVHAKDVKAVSEALKDAFEILDSMPHEEGEHTYDAQNQKAAKGEY